MVLDPLSTLVTVDPLGDRCTCLALQHKKNLVEPFLVHKLLGPRPPPPPLPPTFKHSPDAMPFGEPAAKHACDQAPEGSPSCRPLPQNCTCGLNRLFWCSCVHSNSVQQTVAHAGQE